VYSLPEKRDERGGARLLISVVQRLLPAADALSRLVELARWSGSASGDQASGQKPAARPPALASALSIVATARRRWG
jgi:hypothetical protein